MITLREGTKRLIVPVTERTLGVSGDAHVERRDFLFPRYTTDGVDLSTLTIKVSWTNANGQSGASYPNDVAVCDQDDAYVVFSWAIPTTLSAKAGEVTFSVSGSDGDTIKFMTLTAVATIGSGEDTPVEDSEVVEETIASGVARIGQATIEGVADIATERDNALDAIDLAATNEKTSISNYADSKKTEINTYTEAKKTVIGDYADERINDMNDIFNSIYDELERDTAEEVAKIEAKGTAVLSSINTKETESIGEITTATTNALNSIGSTKTSAVTDVNNAKTNALSSIGTEVTKAQTAAANASTSATNAQTSATSAKNDADRAQAVKNSIPADYSQLSESINEIENIVVGGGSSYDITLSWLNRVYDTGTGTLLSQSAPTRLSTSTKFLVTENVKVTPNALCDLYVFVYSMDGVYDRATSTGRGWASTPYILDTEHQYNLVLRYKNNANISASSAPSLISFTKETVDNGLVGKVDLLESLYATESYQLEEDSLCEKVEKDKDANTVTFVCVTDTHHSPTYDARKQIKIAKAIAERISAKFIVHLGDTINGYENSIDENKKYLYEFWESLSAKNTMPSMYAIGHHELYGRLGESSYLNDSTAIPPTNVVGICGKSEKYANTVKSQDGTSWYMDVDGIRFISLDSVSNTAKGFSNDVVTFLQSALDGCTLPVCVFAHVPCNRGVNYGNAVVTNNAPIANALNQYSNGCLAYIHGHVHWDNIATVSGYTFPFYSVCCALPSKIDMTKRCDLGNPIAYDRARGTYSEYCFDVFNIHKDTNTVKSFRFGVGTDRQYQPN